jgi:hypothetical protein
MTLAVFALSIARISRDPAVFKIVNVVLTSLVLIFTISAFGNYNAVCYATIQEDYDSGFTVSHSAGFSLEVCAWFFMLFVFAFNLLTPSDGGVVTLGDTPTATSAEKV